MTFVIKNNVYVINIGRRYYRVTLITGYYSWLFGFEYEYDWFEYEPTRTLMMKEHFFQDPTCKKTLCHRLCGPEKNVHSLSQTMRDLAVRSSIQDN